MLQCKCTYDIKWFCLHVWWSAVQPHGVATCWEPRVSSVLHSGPLFHTLHSHITKAPPLTSAGTPNSNISGPFTTPPPMPNNPAIKPAIVHNAGYSSVVTGVQRSSSELGWGMLCACTLGAVR